MCICEEKYMVDKKIIRSLKQGPFKEVNISNYHLSPDDFFLCRTIQIRVLC